MDLNDMDMGDIGSESTFTLLSELPKTDSLYEESHEGELPAATPVSTDFSSKLFELDTKRCDKIVKKESFWPKGFNAREHYAPVPSKRLTTYDSAEICIQNVTEKPVSTQKAKGKVLCFCM